MGFNLFTSGTALHPADLGLCIRYNISSSVEIMVALPKNELATEFHRKTQKSSMNHIEQLH
jgi:hypothetical protein